MDSHREKALAARLNETPLREWPSRARFSETVVITGDAQHRWWSCCWGHIFEHDPVAEDDELRCPAFFDDEEPCGTYFVFEPFASRQEAVDALKPGSPRPRWAPWAN